jgi:protein-tyrosine phosphatase
MQQKILDINAFRFEDSKIIFLSQYPNYCSKKFEDFLRNNNIKYIINLTEESIQIKLKNITILNFPIEDGNVPDIYQYIKFIDSIDKIIKNNNILVHCIGGKGRTGLIVAGLAIKRFPNNYVSDILTKLRTIRKGLIESKEQFEFLQQYQQRFQ